MFKFFSKLIRRILSFFGSLGKKPIFRALSKSDKNPIILPNPENDWEAWQTFNPGVVLLGDKVHFLYRAMGPDGASRLGYANSGDGVLIDERISYPVYRHEESEGHFDLYSFASGGGWGGAEDPRMVRMDGEDRIYMTYVTFKDGIRVALTSISEDDFENKRWRWRKPFLISEPGEAHKNWVVFPEKIGGKYAVLHGVNPKVRIEYLDSLDFDDESFIKSFWKPEKRKSWDNWVRGAGAPPIKTKYGWLLFYHAMTEGEDGYKVGAMILDLNDPTRIIRRSEGPVLSPEETYENDGYKSGIVYASGAVVKDGSLMVYYGGSDSYVCVASAPLDEFLDSLMKGSKPALKKKKVRVK